MPLKTKPVIRGVDPFLEWGGGTAQQPMQAMARSARAAGGCGRRDKPLSHQGVFAFSELRLSDLVHTLGEILGKLKCLSTVILVP